MHQYLPHLLMVVILGTCTAALDDSGSEDTTVSPAAEDGLTASSNQTDTELPDLSWYVPGCLYYCIWKKRPYCCDDGTHKSPPDHDAHGSLSCPPMKKQICKKDGVYMAYIPGTEYTPLPADTPLGYTGATLLADGSPKKLPVCASDGYCSERQRCCPSRCAGRHICLLGLKAGGKDDVKNPVE